MKNEYELTAVDQNELMKVEGGDMAAILAAKQKSLTDAIHSVLDTLKNPDIGTVVTIH
jgi:hypothetical protein